MHTGSLLVMLASVLAAGADPDQKKAPAEARLSHCLVSMIEDVNVAAEFPGVLVAIEAKEGLQVEVGTLLARINDNQAQNQKRRGHRRPEGLAGKSRQRRQRPLCPGRREGRRMRNTT